MRHKAMSLAAVASLAVAVLVPQAALAGRAIDVNALTPVPPPFLICKAVGDANGAICTVRGREESTADDIFASCGAPDASDFFWVLGTDSGTLAASRLYNDAGLIVERVFHEDYRGTLTNSATGKSIPLQGHVMTRQVFTTPGSLDGFVETDDGQVYSSAVPGFGLAVHDVGTVSLVPDGAILDEHGPHPLLDWIFGDSSGLQNLCEVLAG